MTAVDAALMKRILVIRGGAIGDFVLTLPAIKLLREAFPEAHLEILGHRPIAALAERRFYADAIRSIESGTLAPFFARDAALSAELAAHFASFDLIVSYLSDPDRIFQDNLKRCGIKMLIMGPSKPNRRRTCGASTCPAARTDRSTFGKSGGVIYPTDEDRAFARDFLGDTE